MKKPVKKEDNSGDAMYYFLVVSMVIFLIYLWGAVAKETDIYKHWFRKDSVTINTNEATVITDEVTINVNTNAVVISVDEAE